MLRKVYVPLILLALILSGMVSASRYWVGFYGSPGYDGLKGVSTMPNGDIVAVGSVSINGTTYPWVIELDRYGRVKWSRYYVLPRGEGLFRVLGTDGDGNIMAVGSLKRVVNGTLVSDLLVVKLDESGNVLWAKTYDLGATDTGTSILVSGNAIFTGGYTQIGENLATWIMRLNPYGDVVWQRIYLGVYPTFKPFLGLNGSNLLALGVLDSGSPVVLSLNPLSGGVERAVEYVNVSASSPIISASDGFYFLADGNGTCITILNASGDWNSYIPGLSGMDVVGMAYNGRGGLFAVSPAKVEGGISFYLLGTSGGKVLVSRIYRLSNIDVPGDVAVSGDSLIVVGTTERFSYVMNSEGFIARLPYNGAVGGYESRDVDPSVFTGVSEVRAVKITSKTVSAKVSKVDLSPRAVPQVAFLRVHVPNAENLAKVYVDGKILKLVDEEAIFTLSPGTHTIRVLEDGYYPYEATVSIEAGREASVTVKLIKKPKKGTLVINSTPSHATVYLNDTLVGWTPLRMNLSPGIYEVKLVKEGHAPYTVEVKVTSGKETRINAVLSALSTTSTTTSTTTRETTTSSYHSPTTSTTTTESTSKKSGGICGTASLMVIAVVSLLLWRFWHDSG